jgi:methylmalonyl-CoA/ethylmalonyl-CoA epimerase
MRAMPTIIGVNHIAVVVEDIQQALSFWRGGLGLQVSHIEDMPEEHSRVAFLPLGDCEIELVQPIGGESGLSRFLHKRGPGMHHLCLEVDDLQGTLASLQTQGIELIHESPLTGRDGTQYAFIHPRAAGGVLVELYQLPVEQSP